MVGAVEACGEGWGFVVVGAKCGASGKEERRGRIGNGGVVGRPGERTEKEGAEGAERPRGKLWAELGRIRKPHRMGGVVVILAEIFWMIEDRRSCL